MATDTAALQLRRNGVVFTSTVTVEERREREEKRIRAIEAVHTALEEANKKQTHARPLRRFGCALSVVIVHHKLVNGSPARQRKMTQMMDDMKFDKLHDWVDVTLALKPGAAKGMILQYNDSRGCGVRILTHNEHQTWLDDLWTQHPAELQVFELEALVEDSSRKEEELQSIFGEFDTDGDGELSLAEATTMLQHVRNDEKSLHISQEDLRYYTEQEFKKYDTNKDGAITYDEFVLWYNSLNGFVRQRLSRENRHDYAVHASREAYVEAHSATKRLGEVISVMSGTLTIDAHGHDYGIEVKFQQGCVCDRNYDAMVHAQTLIDDKVDHFHDDTERQSIGQLFSPIIAIDISDNEQFEDTYTVRFPHSLDTVKDDENDTDTMVFKEDIIVAFGDVAARSWSEVRPEAFELLPAEEDGYPTCKVTLAEPGVVALFSRAGKPICQRAQCLAFLPSKIIPLEVSVLRVYVCPVQPDAVEEVCHREQHSRGLVVLAGRSDAFEVRCPPSEGKPGSTSISISVDEGGGVEKHGAVWAGEIIEMEYEFDPEVFQKALHDLRTKAGETDLSDVQGHADQMTDHIGTKRHNARRNTNQLHEVEELQAFGNILDNKIDIKVEVSDMTQRVCRRKPVKVEEHSFQALVNMHDFPPPSAPYGLRVTTRSTAAIGFEWEPPDSWGGCALAQYEIELREKSLKGILGDWEIVYLGSADHPKGAADMNVFACEVRVRAYNCAEAKPSEWSPILSVGSVKEEEALRTIQKQVRGKKGRQVHKDYKVAAEGQVAVLEDSVDSRVRVEARKHKQCKAMDNWSPFRVALGELYLEMGVERGVKGKLFEFTIPQVESLMSGQSTSSAGIAESKPLLTLACVGAWALQTMAHHVSDSDSWILFMNDVSGLLNLAAVKKFEHGEITDSDAKFFEIEQTAARQIIYVLHEIHELLRQCEPGGFITCQLEYRYDKKLKKLLVKDLQQRLESLRDEVAMNTMAIVLAERDRHVGRGETKE